MSVSREAYDELLWEVQRLEEENATLRATMQGALDAAQALIRHQEGRILGLTRLVEDIQRARDLWRKAAQA